MNESSTARATMSVGENIRQKREELKLSQGALGEKIGSTEKTVARWESDKNFPGADAIIALAQVFNCSTDELLLERHERDVSPEMRALFRRFADLPEEMKPIVKSVINGVISSFEEAASRQEVA
ncbi:prophage PSPPH05, DNA-binding protein [Pseudomonas luteola]|uniref:Prophage PSPPH05, DNA-binding protein n=1 Tax=Pseudomonas luteola TaxID=47886 RepID=A0A2X2D6Y5_PSELU|nr:helix-turn-helix transcriptional regulator [Pseudomonas luteola]SPZ16882.1 prophage PSPPH05, DNA-binding protein [Pseudomonas luteola]SPZ16885.1 prophage PSPPH05, DNA-binding protein [Pseudomonas luteola]SPZ16896.1 prophage PSPPH05, DNA-binding protein [Pseudomonas luteola]